MRTIVPLHPTTDKFSANHNPLSKNFFEKPIYALIYHKIPVGFEAAKRKLPDRPKGIKRACFPSLATVESRLCETP